MPYFPFSFSFFALIRANWPKGSPQSHQAPTPRHRPSISMLPAEILLMIQELLPPASAASFVLCSRAMLNLLGNRSLLCLRLDDQATERRRLLSRLAKDLPDWLLCYRCCVLHPVKSIQLPTEARSYRELAECIRADDVVSIGCGFNIRYNHAQLIMRDHRLGRSTKKSLQQLSHVYRADYDNEKLKHTIRGKIINHELVITVVTKRCLHGRWDFKDINCRALRFCCHILGHDVARILSHALTHRANNSKVASCEETEVTAVRWQYCDKCPTRYTITVSEPRKKSTEVRIEVRRNLGSCKTPFETNWSVQKKGLGHEISSTMQTATLWTAQARDEIPEGLKIEDNSHS